MYNRMVKKQKFKPNPNNIQKWYIVTWGVLAQEPPPPPILYAYVCTLSCGNQGENEKLSF